VVQRAYRRALDLRLVGTDALGPEPDLTRSELERLFLKLCRRRRLPRPEVNVRVGPYEVDFLWRDRRMIVETDGFEYHRSRAAFEADRARDATLQGLGYRVLRVTYRQVRESPAAVVASLRAVIRRGA
jgi:very-short-patch-repair endonuclease